MTSGAYWLGMIGVFAFAAAILYCGYRLRRRLLPSWAGSRARLAEAILALSVGVLLSEALGTVGLFFELPLLLGAGAAAYGCSRLSRPDAADTMAGGPSPPLFPSRPAAIGIALATCLFVLVAWLPGTAEVYGIGINGFDSMWYHLPAAARYAETGSLTALHFYGPVETHWFFPGNSDLLHAIGISILDRDSLSPLINLGWAGLALLAAWCIGRPFGVGAISTAAVGAILVSGLIAGQTGRAKPDIASIALILSTAGILLEGVRTRGLGERLPVAPAAIAVAGLAAGLAVGMRLNSIPAVAVIGVCLIVLARPGGRLLTGAVWFGPVFTTCGFWYLRNLVAAGNPIPQLGIGPLPETDRLEVFRPDSVADVLADADGRDYLIPGLEHVFDDLWFAVVGLALLGMLGVAASREGPVRAVLGVAALVGTVAYLLTPFGATGPGAAPTHFALNLRWVMPMLALGLALVPTLSLFRRSAERLGVLTAVTLVMLVVTFDATRFIDHRHHGTALAVGALVLIVFGALALLSTYAGLSLPQLAGCTAAVAVVAVAAFWPVNRDYLRDRYVEVWPGLNVSASFRWASEVSDARIALSGTTASFLQYGYYGRDLSNRVEYVGARGPRGAFGPIETCAEWKAAVNEGDYDYLVTSPTLNVADIQSPAYAPERDWLAGDPAASPVLEDGPVAVFQLNGSLDPTTCSPTMPA